MRIQATVVEGTTTTEVVVPTAALLKVEQEEGVGIGILAVSGSMSWFAKAVHYAVMLRHGETRPYDEWIEAVDWVDDSSSETITPPTGATAGSSTRSRPSPSGRATRSPSSSTSKKVSKKPSSSS